MKIGQIVYCEGSSAIKGIVLGFVDGQARVAWQPTETVEAVEDLIEDGETDAETDGALATLYTALDWYEDDRAECAKIEGGEVDVDIVASINAARAWLAKQ